MSKNIVLDNQTLCIVGLGSKSGETYAPHRMGKEFVEFLAGQKRMGAFVASFEPFQEDPLLEAEVSRGAIGKTTVVLVKPTHTMNSVGGCIVALQEAGLTASNLVVVHDDISIAPGRYRIIVGKATSASGHKGVLAVEKIMGPSFGRIKIGVGPIIGSVEEFFTLKHSQSAMIEQIFGELLLAFLAVPTIRGMIKSVEILPELIEQWHSSLGDCGKHAIAMRAIKLREVQDKIPGCAISPHPVFIAKKTEEQVARLWNFLLYAIRQANNQYETAILRGERGAPIVRLLERGIPELLIPATRRASLNLNHLRLDMHLVAHDGDFVPRVIELNTAAGGLSSWAIAHTIFRGNSATDQLTCLSMSTAELIWEWGIKPFAKNLDGRAYHIALVDFAGRRIGETGNPLMARIMEENGVQVSLNTNCYNLIFAPEKGLCSRRIDSPIDLLYVLTNYAVNDRALAVLTPAVREAIAAGAIRLFPSPRNFLFASKAFLAALSNPIERAVLGIDEKHWQKIKYCFPWCRMWNAETASTAEEMRRAGLTIVRKPLFGSGGRGVEILGPLSFRHQQVKFSDAEVAVVQSYAPAPRLETAPDFFYDLLASIYTNASGTIIAMPVHSRVFSGAKVGLSGDQCGGASVFLYNP